MSVAVLNLEDSLMAINLNHVSRMILDSDGLWFELDGVSYATYQGQCRTLYLHSETGQQSAVDMWNKFINM